MHYCTSSSCFIFTYFSTQLHQTNFVKHSNSNFKELTSTLQRGKGHEPKNITMTFVHMFMGSCNMEFVISSAFLVNSCCCEFNRVLVDVQYEKSIILNFYNIFLYVIGTCWSFCRIDEFYTSFAVSTLTSSIVSS